MRTIEHYCLISPQKVALSGQDLFVNDGNLQFHEFLKSIYYKLDINYLKFFKMDNLSRLGFLTSEILLKKTKFDTSRDGMKTGIVLANSASSLESDVNFQETIQSSDNYFPSPSVFVYTLPNIVIGEICIRNKIFGQNVFFVSENFEPDFYTTFVNEMFVKTGIEQALVGWVDCYLERQLSFMMYVSNNGCGIEFSASNLKNLASYF